MAVKSFSGGKALQAKLRELSAKISKGGALNVGFLEGATYPDGTPIASIAAAQEFGATINIPAHETTIYRRINAAGTAFLRNGKFVKRSKANFQSTHMVPAHTVTLPPRPFFRRMIHLGKDHWGDDLGKILKDKNYNTLAALKTMGNQMRGELQQSITDQVYKPLAASTVRNKGFATTLTDTGDMKNSVDYEVKE